MKKIIALLLTVILFGCFPKDSGNKHNLNQSQMEDLFGITLSYINSANIVVFEHYQNEHLKKLLLTTYPEFSALGYGINDSIVSLIKNRHSKPIPFDISSIQRTGITMRNDTSHLINQTLVLYSEPLKLNQEIICIAMEVNSTNVKTENKYVFFFRKQEEKLIPIGLYDQKKNKKYKEATS